ncbi:MAG: hypothetical protein KAG06_07920 [Methylococcales bacterium]|nr:hypothetical protein [Methylococcales bacterium]
MKLVKFIIFILLTIQLSIIRAEVPYSKYRNQRFSFSIPYPIDILYPQGESGNGDGQVFLSRDAQIELRCWAGYSMDESLEVKYDGSIFEEKNRSKKTVITYKPKKNNWFVISGIDNVKKIIFYRKVFLIDDVFKECLITYPENVKNKMDKIASKMFNGFVPR